jgi:Phosphoesterase family
LGASTRRRHRRTAVLAAAALGLVAAATAIAPAAVASTGHKPKPKPKPKQVTITSTGLKPGQIKHVWLIILENKSYDATFTGLNQNSYLWKTLPSQGVLLKNYYGTGHSSMDNYLSLVSGQAPEEDTQDDCSVEDTNFSSNAGIVTAGGSLKKNSNYGQAASAANAAQPSKANAPNGANGCTYPTDVPTLFNQLDAAKETWKGYAQDLGGAQTVGASSFQADTVPGRDDAICGGPGSSTNNPDTDPTFLTGTASNPLPTGVTSFTGTQPNDQYVAKHFPFPWFHSLTGTTTGTGASEVQSKGLTTPVQGGTDCDSSHIANLDNPQSGLFHDLQKVGTTPAFSWITPNNCSDAHDAICKGNNLSGSFTASGAPVYQTPTPDPETVAPKNATGGLYASDLFLKYYIPMIEKSPAFKQGGLIDVTFDEGNPPFTYSGNSFNNANAYGPTLGDKPDASSGIKADAAGENINGKNVHSEPTGPNSTLGTDTSGNQLYPGPGNNAFIDRPPVCTSTAPDVPATCVPGIVEGGAGQSPGARTDSAAGGAVSSFIEDPKILADDTGREVTDTTDSGSPIPANTFVGAVSDTGPDFPTSATGQVTNGSFQLVDQNGAPVVPTGPVTSISLSAEGAPGSNLPAGDTADPLWDAKDPTPGGGDTGSVLISPFIKPGSVSSTYYNHYSWLRTMEDIFGVSKGTDHSKLPAGTVSGGLDGLGHIGYAAQTGLAPFGKDVFTNAKGPAVKIAPATRNAAYVVPASSGLGVAALAAVGLLLWYRRGSKLGVTRRSALA